MVTGVGIKKGATFVAPNSKLPQLKQISLLNFNSQFVKGIAFDTHDKNVVGNLILKTRPPTVLTTPHSSKGNLLFTTVVIGISTHCKVSVAFAKGIIERL
jgi:hypothetical protein